MKLFLSHSNRDRVWVQQVKIQLEKVGIDVYLAEMDPQPGRPLDQKLQQQIDSSDALIVLLTEDAAVSPIVREEIGYAISANKLVVPLVAPTVAQSPALLGMLNGREYIPFDIEHPEEGLLALTNWAQQAVNEEQRSILRKQLQESRALVAAEENARRVAEMQLILQRTELAQLQSTNEALTALLIFAVIVGGLAIIGANQ